MSEIKGRSLLLSFFLGLFQCNVLFSSLFILHNQFWWCLWTAAGSAQSTVLSIYHTTAGSTGKYELQCKTCSCLSKIRGSPLTQSTDLKKIQVTIRQISFILNSATVTYDIFSYSPAKSGVNIYLNCACNVNICKYKLLPEKFSMVL